MKLNRAQFKKILKECIRELITEGAFDNVIKENVQAPTARLAPQDLVAPGHAAPQQPFNSVGHMTPNQRLRELSRVAAAQAGKGDPKQAAMMESIFADTAMTTLQHQLGTEMGGGGGVYLGEQASAETDKVDQAELNALSGGRPKNHWAALAFGKYEKK